jgi:hypothetical protein
MKYLFFKSNISIPDKLCLSFLSIVIFSLVYYLFCRDDEFSGIVELIYKKNKIKYFDSIFNKFSQNKIFITKDEFAKIPLVQYEGKIIFDYKEKPNKKINNDIFDIYDRQNDGKIIKSTFETLPIQYDPEFLDINDMVIRPKTNKSFVEFEKWFYYLYYSTVTQAGLGYGDIIPITLKTRFFALLQIIVSLVIIFY